GERLAVALVHGAAVVRMDVVEELLVGGLDRVRREPVDAVELVRPPHRPVGDVPLPAADARQALRLLELAARNCELSVDGSHGPLTLPLSGKAGVGTPATRSRRRSRSLA